VPVGVHRSKEEPGSQLLPSDQTLKWGEPRTLMSFSLTTCHCGGCRRNWSPIRGSDRRRVSPQHDPAGSPRSCCSLRNKPEYLLLDPGQNLDSFPEIKTLRYSNRLVIFLTT
jgi:hypothetical protein